MFLFFVKLDFHRPHELALTLGLRSSAGAPPRVRIITLAHWTLARVQFASFWSGCKFD